MAGYQVISTDLQAKQSIRDALLAGARGSLAANALTLLHALGYRSDKRLDLTPNTPENFLATYDTNAKLNREKALLGEWESVDLLFQLTGEEIAGGFQGRFVFETGRKVDGAMMESYLFFAVRLRGARYARGQLAGITREINKLFPMPVLVIFQHGDSLTLSIINRRLHKVDESRDVLQKVTLIKDISLTSPHRAHAEILFDLSLPQLREKHGFTNFVELHQAWQKTLDSSELNKRFFREVANWYFWAIQNVNFPRGAGEDEATRNATSVIRLITRLIFVWFLKEKGLVPDDLFDQRRLNEILNRADDKGSTYYKAILQNLFFATLNQEMNSPGKRDKRYFRHEGQNYNITTLYRYERYLKTPDEALALFAAIPFLNGGLFDCLDKPDKRDPKEVVRVDGFSDRPDNELVVPDFLFFSAERDVDLNEIYDTKSKHYKTRGLVDILSSYKFTVEENTPIEEEIALDPELLGKVFENLLAAYNPETGVTARKQTGSFYTPRQIVDYMVDESLIAYLESALAKAGGGAGPPSPESSARLRHLFAYTDGPHQFTEHEVTCLIQAIDSLKVLDPACGSGAFPMGMLHKLVFILAKLDPGNQRWEEKQLAKAEEFSDVTVRERAIADIEQAFARNELDYGRKLYLIENCIYGVDIQPIAVQIAKLRFFISLVVDQRIDEAQENRGIRPLPNLETRFVAANALLPIAKPDLGARAAERKQVQAPLVSMEVQAKERELAAVRRSHFGARTPKTKTRHRERDAQLRAEISDLLRKGGLPWETSEKLAHWDPYDQNVSADYFDPEWMFGVADGFDITIGNPPYVRADSGEAHLALRRAIEASGYYETLWERWDLYIPFIERAYKLLKPGGFTTMIVSDAFCHSKYAQKSQGWFLDHSRVRRMDFFSKIQIFDAAVRNITYLFQKAEGCQNRPERRLHNPGFGMVSLLPSLEQIKLTYRAFFPEEATERAISNAALRLGDICYVSFGCRPNSDERVARGQFVAADLVAYHRDREHPKPYIEAKDIVRWVYCQDRWLEWGTERSPGLLARPTFEALYEVPEKIVAADVSGAENRAAYDSGSVFHSHTLISFVPWHTLSGIRNNSLKKSARYANENTGHGLPRREQLESTSRRFSVKYLVAVMNSGAARDFLRAKRRSNIHLYPDDWKKLPIPDVGPEEQAPVVELVDSILAAKRADPKADVSGWEQEIDRLVNGLYGLAGCESATGGDGEPK